MTTPPPVTGQDIGMAQNAIRALLDNLLAEAGTDFEEWLVLRLLAQSGRPIGRVALADNLANGLTIATVSVQRLLVRTASRGYLHQVLEGYALTDHGAETYRRLNGRVAELTTKLYGDFDPDDLATTGRVLREVVQKAAALG